MGEPQKDNRVARRRTPPPERQRGREIATMLLAFLAVYLAGQPVLEALHQPPFPVILLLLVLMYVIAYYVIWRLAGLYWRK